MTSADGLIFLCTATGQIDDDAKVLSHLTIAKLDEYCYDNGYLERGRRI